MPKFKVAIAGQEHEVDIDGVITADELAAKYVTREQADALANDRAAKARREAEAAVVKGKQPLEAQLTEAQTQVKRLRERMRDATLIESAREAGIRPALLKPAAPGARPPLAAMLSDLFAYDEETGDWALRHGDDGFAVVAKDGRATKVGIQDFLKSWATDKANAEFLDSDPQRLPGMRPGAPTAAKTIMANDSKAFLENIDDIAAGKVAVST